jgi:hypothetical protein
VACASLINAAVNYRPVLLALGSVTTRIFSSEVIQSCLYLTSQSVEKPEDIHPMDRAVVDSAKNNK